MRAELSAREVKMSSISILVRIVEAIKNGENTMDCQCGGHIDIYTKKGKLAGAQCTKCGWKLII